MVCDFRESYVWIYISISLKSIHERHQCGTRRVNEEYYTFIHSITICLLYPLGLLYYIADVNVQCI